MENKNRHYGSAFSDFLKEEKIYDEVNKSALEKVEKAISIKQKSPIQK